MAFIQELLEYQKVDSRLREIEKELAGSEERKKYVQAKKFMETAPEKLEAQDRRAVELRKSMQDMLLRIDELSKTIAEYDELDEMLEEGGDAAFYKKSVQNLLDSLHHTKSELNRLISDVESADEEYKKMKKATILMQRQYKEYNEKYKERKDSRAEEVNAITAELKKIGAGIPADVLARYNAKRKENIFPIIAPLNNDMCMCGMSFPIAQQGALSGGNVIECEHCRRFVYKA